MHDDERRSTGGRVAGEMPGGRLASEVEPWASIMKYVIKPTDDPSTWIFPKRGTPPPEMAGKWVAWAADMQTIVASGETMEEVDAKVGDQVVSYQFVPRR